MLGFVGGVFIATVVTWFFLNGFHADRFIIVRREADQLATDLRVAKAELAKAEKDRDQWKAVGLKYPSTNNELLRAQKQRDGHIEAIGRAVEILIERLPKAMPEDRS